MELEPRTAAPAHATGAVEFVPLSEIADDATFRLRGDGDVAALAASIGRLGHLVPIELRPLRGAEEGGPRYQVIAGFRRLAALRLLARERVLARVHEALDEDDAWAIALAQALLGEPLLASELEALRARLQDERVAPWAEELVEEALVRTPVDPEQRERFLEFLAAPPGDAGDRGGAGGGDGAEDGEALDRESDPAAGEPGAQDEPPAEEAGDIEVTPEELAADVARRLSDLNQDLALAFEAWSDLPEEGRRMIVDQARYVAELFPLLAGRR